MKLLKSSSLIVLLFINLFSCKKDCNCTQNWDINITYTKDDLVNYNGKCWVAIAQGKGIEPGPWFENGNDIWEECEE